nr:carbohydrate binding family 9 domain-containing protein [Haliscomenobacter sp.]
MYLQASIRMLSVFFAFTTLIARAQDAEIFKPDSIKKTIEAVKINTTLNVDGRLNEAEWIKAPNSPRFIQVEPLQGEAPNYETDVKVLFNRQYLYVGIFSHDSLGKKALRAIDFKRDFDFRQHDLVNLSFDGFNDQRNAMVFATNPFGVQRDLLAFDDIYYDTDWDGLWRVRSSRTDSGWVAEIAIPWQTLRYAKSADTLQHWGFNVFRNRRLSNEISAFSPYPRAFTASRMDYAGLLTNLQPPPPKPNIRFQPYVLTSYDHYKGFEASVKPE